MKTRSFILALLLIQPFAQAGEVTSSILTQGASSWGGGAIKYPEGVPELSVQRIQVEAGGEAVALPIHCHRVPLAAYVTKGSVRVVKSSGEERQFKAGDAFIEVMSQWHKGVFLEPTELIVFYAGAQGTALSVKQGEACNLQLNPNPFSRRNPCANHSS